MIHPLLDWIHLNLGHATGSGKIAFIVVDTWKQHICKTSTRRTEDLCVRINTVLPLFRKLGIKIVFTPYGFEGKHPNLVRPKYSALVNKTSFSPPGPPRRGGAPCDCKIPDKKCNQESDYDVSPVLELDGSDVVCNKGVDRILDDAEYVLFGGIATNLCILARPYGMKKMIGAGYKCALIGDLSESQLLRMDMTFEEENELVLDYYNTYVSPVLHMGEIING